MVYNVKNIRALARVIVDQWRYDAIERAQELVGGNPFGPIFIQAVHLELRRQGLRDNEEAAR